MAKSDKKAAPKKKAAVKKKAGVKKVGAKKKPAAKKLVARKAAAVIAPLVGDNEGILDRLYAVVDARRDANPEVSHSARLLSRGTAKVAQKFGEEAVECLIEAVAGNPDGVVAESADVLYHLLVMWVDAGIRPQDVWAELKRREGVSGIAEKAARPKLVATTKIP